MNWKRMPEGKEKYAAYLCSREWAIKRTSVASRCGGMCERCGLNEMDCVHHLTYARKYNESLTDLAGWCDQCHAYVHGKSDFCPADLFETIHAAYDSTFFGCHVMDAIRESLLAGTIGGDDLLSCLLQVRRIRQNAGCAGVSDRPLCEQATAYGRDWKTN